MKSEKAKMVETGRFELPTSWSRSTRASQTALRLAQSIRAEGNTKRPKVAMFFPAHNRFRPERVNASRQSGRFSRRSGRAVEIRLEGSSCAIARRPVSIAVGD